MKLKKGVNIKQLNPFLKDKLDELDNVVLIEPEWD